jgi:uncharacterized protein (TIGR02996 family)
MGRRQSTAPLHPQVVALLQDSKEHPEDDTPRLVLADWLEEHGDPRGEFVRTQVERARLADHSLPWFERRRRERELLKHHGEAWKKPLRPLGGKWTFHRGLAHLATRVDKVLAAPWDELQATHACGWLEGLSLKGLTGESVPILATSPVLSFLTVLDLLRSWNDNLIDGETIAPLVKSPLLTRLITLKLSRYSIGPHGVWALATSPYLGRLTTLGLSENAIGAEGARALASSPQLVNLRRLELAGNCLGHAGAAMLAAPLPRPHLECLDLAWNSLCDEGVAALARSPLLARLHTLNLVGNGIGDRGAQALARSPHLAQLTRLFLASNDIGDEGVAALATSPHLARLTMLQLAANPFGSGGKETLQKRFGRPTG